MMLRVVGCGGRRDVLVRRRSTAPEHVAGSRAAVRGKLATQPRRGGRGGKMAEMWLAGAPKPWARSSRRRPVAKRMVEHVLMRCCGAEHVLIRCCGAWFHVAVPGSNAWFGAVGVRNLGWGGAALPGAAFLFSASSTQPSADGSLEMLEKDVSNIFSIVRHRGLEALYSSFACGRCSSVPHHDN